MKVNRAKDFGVTRRGILGLLTEPRGIPELERLFVRYRLPKDVTIRTAIKNAIASGHIELLDIPYSSYDAKLYKIKEVAQ